MALDPARFAGSHLRSEALAEAVSKRIEDALPHVATWQLFHEQLRPVGPGSVCLRTQPRGWLAAEEVHVPACRLSRQTPRR